MTKYEAIVVLSVNNKTDEDVQSLVEKFKALIEKTALLKALTSGARESLLTLSMMRLKATTYSSTLSVSRLSRLSSSV